MKYFKIYFLCSYGLLALLFASCTTTPTEIPSVLTTTPVSSITQTTAFSGGVITSDGGSTITARGVCWSTAANPTITGSKTTDGAGIGSFTSSLTGLLPNTSYFVRSYATTTNSTTYGSSYQFTTTALMAATLSTSSVSSISKTTATSGGYISADGGTTVTARGVCWSTSEYPTTENYKTTDGSGTGSFSSSLTGLTENVRYYVRAYATNSAGTTYGPQVNFTTTIIITGSIATIGPLDDERGETWAVCGGNITSESLSPITARGVCWSINMNPTIADNKTSDGAGIGTYTSRINGLTIATSYNIRAYATNSEGTMYGKNITFMTYTLPGTCKDIQGNVYKTIRIGAQVWMAENFIATKTQSYFDIPLANDNSAWGNLVGPAYCDNGNYGKLYNWKAVHTEVVAGGGWQRGIAPNGWRMPTNDDWQILENFMTTNNLSLAETGFNPIFKGDRSENGDFAGENSYEGWWSMSEDDVSSVASSRYIQKNSTSLSKKTVPKNSGLSVRFVRIN